MTDTAATVDQYVIGNIQGHRGGFVVPAPGYGLGLPHMLISGETGSGKSSTVAKLLKGLTADPRIGLVGVDFKAGLELAPWEPRFTTVAETHDTALPTLQAVSDAIPARAGIIRRHSAMEGRTIREWRDDMGPRLVVVLDEMSLVDSDELDILKDIAARGRALGITLVCCTQYALAKRFDTDFLNNIPARICHRMATPTQYATALRVTVPDLNDTGFQPVPATLPGVGYVTGIPGMDDLQRVRSKYVSDQVIDDWVPRYAHLRIPEHEAFR